MDVSFLVIMALSAALGGVLAYAHGRDPWWWVQVGATVGPFAIPALYVVLLAAALRRKLTALRS